MGNKVTQKVKEMNEGKTLHHIFTFPEVKNQLKDLFEIIGRQVDEKTLQAMATSYWNRIPKIELTNLEHTTFHFNKDGRRAEERKQRDKLFDEFHSKLGAQLGLTGDQVGAIRNANRRGETLREFALRMFKKAGLPRNSASNRRLARKDSRSHHKEWYLQVYRFIMNITPEQREILLQYSNIKR